MNEDKRYNVFIRHPSNSNTLINASLIIGFIILVVSQLILFNMVTQGRTRTNTTAKNGVDDSAEPELLLTASDAMLVSCADSDLGDAIALVKPSIVNIDITVSAEGPNLSAYKMQMKRCIASLLVIDFLSVNVKAKTNEGLGEIGTGLAISAIASVLLRRRIKKEL